MSNEPKYRPSLTLAQIDALVAAVGYQCDNSTNVSHLGDAIDAAKVLRLFQMKAEIGLNSPASIPTGGKPGRLSALDIVRQDILDTTISYAEAETQAAFYKSLGQAVPEHIAKILNDGAPQS